MLNNLISNAYKYYNPQAQPPTVRIEFSCNEHEAIISIEDNGVGIESKYLDDIFKVFFRVDSRGTGAGMGLYVVQKIVQSLKGKIEITSQKAFGTRVTIYLPNTGPDSRTMANYLAAEESSKFLPTCLT